LNKSDFYDWKRHPVTQVVFSQIKERINTLKDMLGESAGENPIQDSKFVGALQAYKDLLNIEYESEEESQ